MKKMLSLITCAVIIFCAVVPAFAQSGGCACGFPRRTDVMEDRYAVPAFQSHGGIAGDQQGASDP